MYIYIYIKAKISLAWIKRQVNVTRLTGISTTNPSTEGWGRDEGMIYERVDRWMVEDGALRAAGRKVKRLSADDKTALKAAHRELIYDAETSPCSSFALIECPSCTFSPLSTTNIR